MRLPRRPSVLQPLNPSLPSPSAPYSSSLPVVLPSLEFLSPSVLLYFNFYVPQSSAPTTHVSSFSFIGPFNLPASRLLTLASPPLTAQPSPTLRPSTPALHTENSRVAASRVLGRGRRPNGNLALFCFLSFSPYKRALSVWWFSLKAAEGHRQHVRRALEAPRVAAVPCSCTAPRRAAGRVLMFTFNFFHVCWIKSLVS